MVGSDGDARARMVAGAAEMIRHRGVHATSVRELAKHTGAPLGSTYHHFPGGKSQLAAEAVRWADDLTARRLTEAMAAGPADGLQDFLAMWRQILVDSDFQAGCPVLAVAVEEMADGDSAPRDAAVFAFGNWTTILAGALRESGVTPHRATGTATLIVAAVEGAVAMCRAERATQPLDTVGEQLHDVLRAVLG
ncbi:transcriptional regulatory protein [Mycolicibacterium canariasense]|uniref:Transcriptional regulatory protein n=1 Tax=Mycolicibacterium canariasense TaxID=228230 RepID=A0A100WE99_MYCCR|nr:helix-turn-helix domain-containing protein [Mycolicibacterium canariasense]MCV7209950.1 TetR/AcrR family transcriptional regulator [Mycolicibacterium canariasense]ORV05217.1 TetR family transcriptional regulator [Mycolicibacterium canariasense]GAS96369.1 transcriptional regulatory protein [Mycolicibacterium canariasense]